MTTTTIGKVTLNLIDCEIEEKKEPVKEDLLRIVRDASVIEYPSIIESRLSYEYLYHLSDIRGNIVRWLPVKSGDTVLEIDAECGAITSALVEMSENITALCNCSTDAEILAERFSNCKNSIVYGGDLQKILDVLADKNNTYDWIILRDARLLNRALSLVSGTGRVIFITDNRMGMRYLAGEKAPGCDEYFTGVEGKSESGFTFSGIRRLFSINNISKAQIYYPYPDYRFMKNLYSNLRLPKVGELIYNENNLESDRMTLFSEKDAFDASCEDGSFQHYSNSYLVVIGEPLSVEYARFSNERSLEFKIYTTIENTPGGKIVKKRPIGDAARSHISNISKNYSKLIDRYKGSELKINKCTLSESAGILSADLEYVNGIELSKLMDICLKNDDLNGFYALFDKYTELIGFNDEYGFSDLDLVFSNIIVNDDAWTLIDYEWCKESRIPMRESAYRAIYCYLLEDKNRKKFNLDLLLGKIVLSKEASEEIERDELTFQKHVTGRNLTLAELRERMGFNSVNPSTGSVSSNQNKEIYQFKIYPGGSAGDFSEDTSYLIEDAYRKDNIAEATVAVSKNDTVIRIDPLNAPCIVTVKEAMLGEAEFPYDNKKYLICNGKRLGVDSFIFATEDPNMYFDLDGFIHDEDTFLYVKLEIIVLPSETAALIEKNLRRFL